jgi:hypothetical protein
MTLINRTPWDEFNLKLVRFGVLKYNSKVVTFRILTVLKCPKIAGANSLFFEITGAKAPIAPVLNMSLQYQYLIAKAFFFLNIHVDPLDF